MATTTRGRGRYYRNERNRGNGTPVGSASSGFRDPNTQQPNYNDEDDINLRFPRENKSSSYYRPPQNSGFRRNSNAGRSPSYHNNPGGSQGTSAAQNNVVVIKQKEHSVRAGEKLNQASRESKIERDPSSVSIRNIAADEDDLMPCISGTCPDMCPAKERAQRERLGDLAVFERLNGDPHKTSASIAVKKFCRTISISDTQPSDIRPLTVLWNTMKYLVKLVDSSEHGFEVVHEFVFDRTRAIRQDLTIQNIINHQAIVMHEQMVRFHILSQHKLHHLSNNKDISLLHLNLEQLSKCLKSLLDLYDVTRKSESHSENEAEFYCYYVLMNLGSHKLWQGETLAAWFRSIRPLLWKSKKMEFARNVLRCYRMGNFKGFFNLVRDSTFLEACLMEYYFNEVRAQAVSCINHGGYKLSPFPLVDIAELLLMTEFDMEDFCSLCGLATSTDEKGLKFLPVKQVNFNLSAKGFSHYSCPFIERKLASSYSLVITRTLSQ